MGEQYVIGIDFGSDSVRAILVDTRSAQTLQTAVAEYPRWKEKKYCDDKICNPLPIEEKSDVAP